MSLELVHHFCGICFEKPSWNRLYLKSFPRATRTRNFVFVGVVGIQCRRTKSEGERISGARWGWRRRWLGPGKCCHLLPVMVLSWFVVIKIKTYYFFLFYFSSSWLILAFDHGYVFQQLHSLLPLISWLPLAQLFQKN